MSPRDPKTLPIWRVLTTSLCALALLVSPAALADSNTADAGDLVVIDGGFAQIALYGLIQGQIAGFTGDDNLLQDGDPAEREGFRLRRARFGFEGWAWGMVDFSLSVDLSSGRDAKLLDAWVGYRNFPAIGFTLGAHKVPFSRMALYSSARGTLSERPLGTQAMAPFRQIGITLEGELGGLISYAVGAYNGFERNANFHKGFVENSGFEGNRFDKVGYAGRLSLQPLGAIGKDMADLDGGGLRVGLGTSLYYTNGDTTKNAAWEVDLAVKVAGLHFLAEYIADTSEPKKTPTTSTTVPSTTDRFSLVAEVGYFISAANLGLAFRTEFLNDNRALEDNGDELVLAGGLQYYWHRHHLKASLDYTHRLELEGTERDNQTLLMMLQLSL